MTATTDLHAAVTNPTNPCVRPHREAWVSLIAGYCFFLGGVEVAWQVGRLFFSQISALSEIQNYLEDGSLKFDWSRPWAFAFPLSEIWNRYVLVVVHLIVGLILWANLGKQRALATIALLASLLGAVLRVFSEVGQFVQQRGIFGFAAITIGFIHCASMALPCILLWAIHRDVPNRDRWRAVLALWLVFTGIFMLFLSLNKFSMLRIFGNPFVHPGWRTLSWDTLWPMSALLILAAGVIGITCGIRVFAGTPRLVLIGWVVAIVSSLNATANSFQAYIISNHSTFSVFPSTAPLQFAGFQAVGWDDWAEVLHSLLISFAAGVPLIIFAHHQARHLESESGACRHCGYNLTGNTSGRCPECGTPVKDNVKPGATTT